MVEAAVAAATKAAGSRFGEALYDAEQRDELPDAAALASLGCGNPVAVAELREGDVVLDLGSGGGIDVILSARRVGPTGDGLRAGHDRRDAGPGAAERARGRASRNVHFLKGVIEAVPLPAASVDVVISNCVINLSTDKAAVLAEIARVLRPGGRVGVSDVVAEDRLSPQDRAERGSYVGCIAGALSKEPVRGRPGGRGVRADLRRVHPRCGRRAARRHRQGREGQRAHAGGAAGGPARRSRRLLLMGTRRGGGHDRRASSRGLARGGVGSRRGHRHR